MYYSAREELRRYKVIRVRQKSDVTTAVIRNCVKPFSVYEVTIGLYGDQTLEVLRRHSRYRVRK